MHVHHLQRKKIVSFIWNIKKRYTYWLKRWGGDRTILCKVGTHTWFAYCNFDKAINMKTWKIDVESSLSIIIIINTSSPWDTSFTLETRSNQLTYVRKAMKYNNHNIDQGKKKPKLSFLRIERYLFVKHWVPFTQGCFVPSLVESSSISEDF